MLTQDYHVGKPEIEFHELDMEMITLEKLQELPPAPQRLSRSTDLKNLVANENSERSSETKNFRGQNQQAVNDQVMQELRQLESDEFKRLTDKNGAVAVADKQKKSDGGAQKKSDLDWYREQQHNKSYNGTVAASFSMKGRDILDNPLPTYRCRRAGKVVVRIDIDETGRVTNARIDEASSDIDDCLRSESLSFGSKWKFSYSGTSRKQSGTITFTFASQ
jgi:TonB family protein